MSESGSSESSEVDSNVRERKFKGPHGKGDNAAAADKNDDEADDDVDDDGMNSVDNDEDGDESEEAESSPEKTM